MLGSVGTEDGRTITKTRDSEFDGRRMPTTGRQTPRRRRTLYSFLGIPFGSNRTNWIHGAYKDPRNALPRATNSNRVSCACTHDPHELASTRKRTKRLSSELIASHQLLHYLSMQITTTATSARAHELTHATHQHTRRGVVYSNRFHLLRASWMVSFSIVHSSLH